MDNDRIKMMPNVGLKDYIDSIYDVCIEVIRRNGWYKYWAASGYDEMNPENAFWMARTIVFDPKDKECILNAFEELWDQSAMEAAGISEEEYYENPDVPLWKRDDWMYDEEEEEWKPIEGSEDDSDEDEV